MSFMFTPGCCCGGCPSCANLLASGLVMPCTGIKTPENAFDDIIQAQGQDCQYGYAHILYKYRFRGLQYFGVKQGYHIGGGTAEYKYITYFKNGHTSTCEKDGETYISSKRNGTSPHRLYRDISDIAENGSSYNTPAERVWCVWKKCEEPIRNTDYFYAILEARNAKQDSIDVIPSIVNRYIYEINTGGGRWTYNGPDSTAGPYDNMTASERVEYYFSGQAGQGSFFKLMDVRWRYAINLDAIYTFNGLLRNMNLGDTQLFPDILSRQCIDYVWYCYQTKDETYKTQLDFDENTSNATIQQSKMVFQTNTITVGENTTLSELLDPAFQPDLGIYDASEFPDIYVHKRFEGLYE